MPQSRPSRISAAVRAQLFAAIGQADDGRVDRAIAILIARYVSSANPAPSPIEPIASPVIAEPEAVENEYDDDFN